MAGGVQDGYPDGKQTKDEKYHCANEEKVKPKSKTRDNSNYFLV